MLTHLAQLRSSAPSQTWRPTVLSGSCSGSLPQGALRANVLGHPGGKPSHPLCGKEMASPFGRNPYALDCTTGPVAYQPVAYFQTDIREAPIA